MKRLAWIVLLCAACRSSYAPAPVDAGPRDAVAEATKVDSGPVAARTIHAAFTREVNLAASTGIGIATANNANGTVTYTITNTAPAGGSATPSGPAGGDLGGTYPNPTVISVANITTGTLGVTHGGTGDTSLAAHTVLVGSGTGGISQVGPGTSGVPLLSGGAGADPSFTALSLSGVGITGTLTAGSGGTGVSNPTAHALIVGEGSSPVASIAVGGLNKVVLGQGAGTDPAFSAYTIAAPGTSGNVLTSDGTNWTSATGGYIKTYYCNGNSVVAGFIGQQTICSLSVTTLANSNIIDVSSDFSAGFDYTQVGASTANGFTAGVALGTCSSSPSFSNQFTTASNAAINTVWGGTSVHFSTSLGTTGTNTICAVMSKSPTGQNTTVTANLVVRVAYQ